MDIGVWYKTQKEYPIGQGKVVQLQETKSSAD